MFHARKSLFVVLAIVALLASACGSLNAEPTPSLQELQLTAQAAAAMTLTAQAPTATPVTPSPTPIPVIVTVEPVLEIIPTQPPVVVQPQPVVVVPPAATDEKKEQDCSKAFISAGTEGPRASVSIINRKSASILLSYYLEPTPFGQCGSGSVNIGGDEKTLNLPVGCYYLYAWVTHEGKDQSFQGYSCLPKKGITWLIFPDHMEEVAN